MYVYNNYNYGLMLDSIPNNDIKPVSLSLISPGIFMITFINVMPTNWSRKVFLSSVCSLYNVHIKSDCHPSTACLVNNVYKCVQLDEA